MRHRLVRCLPALVLLAACESDSTGPTASVDATLALMASNSIGAYGAVATASGVPVSSVAAPPPSTSSCSYSAASSFFECAPVTANGLTFTRSFQLQDASGSALTTPNPAAVAAVRVVTDVSGTTTITAGGTTTTLGLLRHEDATMSGLTGPVRVLNGGSTQHLESNGGGNTMVVDDTSTTTNLQIPASGGGYPLGGTISSSHQGTLTTPAGSGTFHGHTTLTFNGTSIVTLTQTVGGSTSTCTFDLANPSAPPSCS